MRRTMILAGVVLAGCQAAPAQPPTLLPQAAPAPVERLTWAYRASYEVDLLRAAAQDRRIRIAVTCGFRPQTWGERASELVGNSIGRTLRIAQLPAAEEQRLRLIGSAMRAQAHYLAGMETQNTLSACTNFMARNEMDALRGYLTAADPSFPG